MSSIVAYQFLLCIIISMSYVAFIYYRVPHELQGKDRNDIGVIRFRMIRVSILCVILYIGIPFVYGRDMKEWTKDLGIIPGFTRSSDGRDLVNIGKSLVLILVLYIGPIVKYYLSTTLTDQIEDLKYSFFSIYGFRDHIFAPISEEFIYRSIILNIVPSTMINYTPFLFGIAHFHHGYQLYYRQNYELRVVIANVGFQLLYTSLFGYLMNHIWYEYFNVWSNIIIHLVCNLIGFPEMEVEKYRWGYYGLLVVGVIGFVKMLRM
ncbi:uncharacterized protein RJT21DRAFT_52393 [Scheffersomyces amazonensis]|uniref:uncharacterized protein n=1 Tax=Scheffersomyces amazonensis TaxID=1078765 RepID=UPI00315D2546